MDWLDLLAVQGTLESSPTPQFKSINSLALSFLYSSTLPYMTTGKTISLARWTFVNKVMSLLFSRLFRFVIAFLPRSKQLLIFWLQLPSTVLLDPPKESLSLFPLFPHLFAMKCLNPCHDLSSCFLIWLFFEIDYFFLLIWFSFHFLNLSSLSLIF